MKTASLRFLLTGLVFLLLALFVLPRQSQAQGILYYARTDGTVPAINVATGTEVKVIASSEFIGANPGAAREIAFDPVTRLMWYSSTDNQIYSVNVDTLADGPGITNIPGAIVGAERHLFIDYAHRKLIVPITDGSVMFYNLSDQQAAGSIPANFFTDGNVGTYRHFASDGRTGMLWFATTAGTFLEMNPVTVALTGRSISFGQQTGANPGAYRHFYVDTVRDLLVYMVTDDSMASINLTTLQAGTYTLPGNYFTGAVIGAGRVITIDNQYLKATASAPSGGQFSLSWPNIGPGYQYTVEYRDSVTSGSWASLPGTTWPVTSTMLNGIPASQSTRFYRVSAAIP